LWRGSTNTHCAGKHSSDAKVANRNVGGFGWEIAHAVVSRRPPISLDTSVARNEGYTHAANVWDVSIVQAPFSVAPCQTKGSDSHLLHRCTGVVIEQGCTPLARFVATGAHPYADGSTLLYSSSGGGGAALADRGGGGGGAGGGANVDATCTRGGRCTAGGCFTSPP
jgi:hypothetical protein